MFKGPLILVVLLLSASSINAAQRIFGECNNCTSTQMRNMATNLAPAFSINQMVYVYDFTAERINKYLVDKETEPGSSFIYVREVQMETAIKDDFDLAIIALQSFNLPMNNPIDVTDYPSAFDVVNNVNAQRALVELARDVEGWRWDVLWWGSAAINVTNRLTGVNVTIRYNFPDGSSVLFRLIDFDPEDLSFTLQFVNGEDADGNAIHQTASGYAGDSGVFNSASSQEAALAYLLSIGVSLRAQSESNGNSGSNSFNCYVEGGTVICEYTQRD